MFKFEPVGKYLINVCSTMSCALLGADELMHHAEHKLGHQGRRHHARRADHAGPRRVPGRVHRGARRCRSTTATGSGSPTRCSTSSSTTCAPAGSTARSRRTARSPEVRQSIPADRAVGAVPPDDVTAEPIWLAVEPPKPERRSADVSDDRHHLSVDAGVLRRRPPADRHLALRARGLVHPRALRGHRRLPGSAQRARHGARPTCTRWSRTPPSSAAVAPASRPASSGGSPRRRCGRATSSSTATRASRARTRTAC